MTLGPGIIDFHCGSDALLYCTATRKLAAGDGYLTDDFAILTPLPIRVRGVPLGIGLKQGSWRVLADKAQGIEELPRHVRLDGRQIRYLPMRGTVDRDGAAVPVRTLIFPEFRPAAGTTSRKLRPADALLRLAAARYDTQLGAYGSLVHRVARQRSEL